MTKKITVKDKLLNDTLDLSCCDLKEVPVKEISVLRRASIVDLSNNDLVELPKNFVILTQIIRLDLSKNNLTEIPENFGELVQLKHLDLYSNQISRLPLSLANLKNLRWLDLKENPLTPAVASVAGPCSNTTDCQNCARNVVNYLSKVKQTLDEAQRLKREIEYEESTTAVSKKESQKKKKKKADKEKNNNSVGESKQQTFEKSHTKSSKNKSKAQNSKTKKGGLMSFLCSAFIWLLWLLFFVTIIISVLLYADKIIYFVEEKTGYKINIQIPPVLQNYLTTCKSSFINMYEKYVEKNSVIVNKEL